jgi:hypothetical protein
MLITCLDDHQTLFANIGYNAQSDYPTAKSGVCTLLLLALVILSQEAVHVLN